MSSYSNDKQLEAEEFTAEAVSVSVNDSKLSGQISLRMKYVDDIETQFHISERTRKIGFTKHLNQSTYKIACKAVKDKLKELKEEDVKKEKANSPIKKAAHTTPNKRSGILKLNLKK